MAYMPPPGYVCSTCVRNGNLAGRCVRNPANFVMGNQFRYVDCIVCSCSNPLSYTECWNCKLPTKIWFTAEDAMRMVFDAPNMICDESATRPLPPPMRHRQDMWRLIMGRTNIKGLFKNGVTYTRQEMNDLISCGDRIAALDGFMKGRSGTATLPISLALKSSEAACRTQVLNKTYRLSDAELVFQCKMIVNILNNYQIKMTDDLIQRVMMKVTNSVFDGVDHLVERPVTLVYSAEEADELAENVLKKDGVPLNEKEVEFLEGVEHKCAACTRWIKIRKDEHERKHRFGESKFIMCIECQLLYFKHVGKKKSADEEWEIIRKTQQCEAPAVYCDMCDQLLQHRQAYDDHCKGKKHLAREAALAEIGSSSISAAPGTNVD